MKKILFLVQLPPPIHGASLMNKTIVDNKRVNSVFDIDIIPIQLASSMKDMGRFSLSKVSNAIKSYLLLLRNLLFNKYDLVYFTLSPLGFAFYKDFILVIILKLFNKKIVYHLHGKGILEKTSKSKFQKILYKFVFNKTEVIVLAEVLYSDIENIYNKKPRVLPNGIPKIIQQQDSNNNVLTFIYLSNLVITKGIIVFIDALKVLKEQSLNFKATIVGASADVSIEELTRLVKKHKLTELVEIVGPAYGVDKYKNLVKSNVFVLPTFYKNECFPLTILEAYQSSLAVISTKNGAIPDMVKDNINGYLTEINNSIDLALKMKHCIENPDIVSKLGANNKEEYERKYTEEIFISNFIEILNAILKQK